MKKIVAFLLVAALIISLVPVSVFAEEILSISYTPRREIVRYFETGGHFETDQNGIEYYRYNVIERSTGDILTVNYNDGRGSVDYKLTFEPVSQYVSTVDPNDIIAEEDIDMFDEQWQYHFSLGDGNRFYVSYMGQTTEIAVNIIINPISSLLYTPVKDIEIYEYTDGDWRERDGEQVFEYNAPWFKEGDRLEITYSENGDTAVYTYYNHYDNERDEQLNGFYDEEFNELPQYDRIYIGRNNDTVWTADGDNFIYVVYKDNCSNEVRVNIVANPVKEIRYERSEDVVILENSNMYYDSWDDRYYYSIPYHREGDKLIIADNDDNETVYEYEEYKRAFVSEGKPDISGEEVHIYTNQHDNPWGLGEHEYTIEYLGRQYSLKATIIENPVKSIEYIRANPIEIIENTNGEYDEEGDYYHYYYSWCEYGDKLIIEDNNGVKTTYTYKQVDGGEPWEYSFVADDGSIIDTYEIRFNDNQYEKHWVIGNGNTLTVEYSGATFDIPVTIKENTVKEIRYEPVNEPTVMYGWRSFYSEWAGYEVFDCPQFSEGDKLIVVDKQDNEKVYVAQYDEHHDIVFVGDDGETIDQSEVWLTSEQWETPWSLGSENKYFVEYLGMRVSVKCTVLENPIETIEYIPAQPTKYPEGTNTYYDEWDEREYYDIPNVNNGDTLVVYYKDESRGRVEYTAYFDRTNDIMTFVSDDDVILVDDKFDFYSDQWETPWEIGENHYYISYLGITTEGTVYITENSIAGISYTSVDMPQVWITDYVTEISEETGEEYKHYNIPDFCEGDILTIHYTDETSKDFVLIFDESDGERYFVNGDEKYHQYTLFRFDKQFENEWELGDGNFYSIDFYGFTADIEVEVIETDVESISFNPILPIVIDENQNGEYIYDDNGQKFYFYHNTTIINLGDMLTVEYKNGDTVVYVLGADEENGEWFLRAEDGSEIDTQEIEIDDHQWDNHWTAGTNYFDIVYHGVRTTAPVIINRQYIPGDINGDGAVGNLDLVQLFRYLTGWNVEVDNRTLDTNNDGKVNNRDLIRLFQYLTGWDVQLF